jgi:hypothetical protein
MRLETERKLQEKTDANLKEIKEDIKTNRAIRGEAIQAKADVDREHMQEMMTTNQERI